MTEPAEPTPNAAEREAPKPAPTKPEPAKAAEAARTPARVRFFGLDLLDNRYPALHGLRVLAILSVIQYHVTWILGPEQGLPIHEVFRTYSTRVFFGMDLFFVLSGFLIGSILLRSLETTGTQQIRRFYVRRIFRTFPSYYLVLTYLVLTTALTEAQRDHLILEYTYLTNFSGLARDQIVMFWGWSLALEEQFYLTVPLLMFLLTRLRTDRARVIFLGALCLAALAVRLGIWACGRPWNELVLYGAVYFRTYTRFDTIIAGMILAIIEMRWGKALGRWLEHPFHRALLALPAMACLWLLLRPDVFGDGRVQVVRLFLWGTVTSTMYLCALPLVLHGDGVVQRFLSRPIWRKLATVGYGVYLVHIPLIDRVVVPMAHDAEARGSSIVTIWIVSFVGVSLASFAIGYLLHVFVEKPSLRIRERLAA